MKDAIEKVDTNNSLAKKPLEWLAIAEDTFVQAMQRLSAAIIQDTDPTETSAIHEWAKRAGKSIKAFEENARNRQLTYIIEQGNPVTDKGTLEITLDNGTKQRAVPTNTRPSDAATRKLLLAKGLSIDTHMDKEVTWRANEAKLLRLCAEQMLTQDEYKQCFDDKVAYRVMSPQPIEEDEE